MSASDPFGLPVPKRTGLRRLAVAVASLGTGAVLAASVALVSGGGGVPAGPPQRAPAQIQVVQQAPWQEIDGRYYRMATFCDTGTNTTLYVTEADRGGGVAAVPGCAAGSQLELKQIGDRQELDGRYYSISELCDVRTGTLLYVTEADRGGGVAAVPNGCAPGALKPGRIDPLNTGQETDGRYYTIRAYRDAGTGNLIYTTESDRGGGIAVVPGAGDDAAGDVQRLSVTVDTDSRWYNAAKFCDVKNGALLYVTEDDRQGSVAVVPGGCAPVADGTVPLSTRHGNPRLIRETSNKDIDDRWVNVSSFCDADNGNRLYLTEADQGGAVSVVPGGCAAGRDGVG